jgi:2-methylcitrate dehydratase PrpD
MLAPRTMDALLDLHAMADAAIGASTSAMARLSLFDWLTVALAGSGQPLAKIVRDLVADEGGKPAASVVGLAKKVPARAAALANGAISHALDYDDTHFAHVGHPSVAVLPATLATAEEIDVPASAVLTAFLIGAEASIRIGVVLGRPHYDRGFHQTATAGAFGATVAASRIMALSRTAARNALSLVASRASGLKSQFGSMGKPYNAGIAAANGVEAAALARLGFISCDDGVGGPQGFVDAHVEETFENEAWAMPPPKAFLFEDIKHKVHACCHGLHGTIEALTEAREKFSVDPSRVARLSIRVNPRWLRVCDIKEPRTGLEAKFSYAMLAAMTLYGIDTAADSTYTDALCRDSRLTSFWPRVEVIGDEAVSDTSARVRVEQTDRPLVETVHDIAHRLPTSILQRRLQAKSAALLGKTAADALWRRVGDLEKLSARQLASLLNPSTESLAA